MLVLPAIAGADWGPGVKVIPPGPYDRSMILGSVSCPSAGDCSAVGTYLDKAGNRQGVLLTETDGTWNSGTEAVLPPGATSSALGGSLLPLKVSCASPGNCSAVGSYTDSSDDGQLVLFDQTNGTWSAGMEASLPEGARESGLTSISSISCPSASNCTAVGSYTDSADNSQGLVLTETNGTWDAGTAATLPANASSQPVAELTTISCPSTGSCTAIGGYTDTSGAPQGLLLSEANGTWAAGTEAALPSDAYTLPNVELSSLSCTSAGNCTAVGTYNATSGYTQGLLLDESDGTWATGTKPSLPANASTTPSVSVIGVSCWSPGDCSAVGLYTDSSGHYQGLLLSESGGAWSTGTDAVLPANAQTDTAQFYIDSVSCGSDGSCGAAGYYTDSSGNYQGLLLTEAGGTWSTGTEASLPGGANAGVSLYSTSCTAGSDCTAVGTYNNSIYYGEGLAVSESDATWGAGSQVSPPSGAGEDPKADLVSVACTSPGNCSAVGSYTDEFTDNTRGMLVNETDGAWAAPTDAVPPGNAASDPDVSFASVSCGSAGNCSGVGSYWVSSVIQQGALWNETNGTWSAGTEADVPPGGSGTTLGSVSCPSAGSCTAVGTYSDTAGYRHGLLLKETDDTWSSGAQADLPANAGSNLSSALSSVSCPSAGTCTGVGSYTDSSDHTQGLLLTENGGSWGTGTEAQLPADAGTEPYATLYSVSCASPGNCTAVGTYVDGSGNREGLLVSEVDGNWSVGTKASLPADADPEVVVNLDSVSCASPGNCSAVGWYSDSSHNQQGLLLTESDGNWGTGIGAVLPRGAGAGANGNPDVTLSSVSCPAPGNCAAVGTYKDYSFSTQGVLLEERAATWSTGLKAALPADANATPNGSLGAVSCGAPGNCGAVGGYYDGLGFQRGLLLGSMLPVNSAPPSISGNTREGETLTESHGSWSPPPTSYRYQWRDCDSSGSNCSNIAGATGQTYTISAGDVGHEIVVSEIAYGGTTAAFPSTSAPTGVVLGSGTATRLASSLPPVISGTAVVGHVVSATAGTWSGALPIAYTYQWQRCQSTCVSIAGAVHSRYRLTAAEAGTKVRVIVAATNFGTYPTWVFAKSAEFGLVQPTTAEIDSALRKIAAVRRGVSMGRLLARGGSSFTFVSPCAGHLTVVWIQPPVRAHRAKLTPKPVVVTTVGVMIAKAGKLRLVLKLTRAGTRLLVHSFGSIRLTSRASFTPRGGKATITRSTFILRR